jgi:hypothetical protein
MPTSSVADASAVPAHYRYVLYGGLVAGTLDLVYICTLWAAKGVGPIRILHSVAAGWLGRDAAIAGGYPAALLGLASHYLIAIAMAAVYFLFARRMAALVRKPLLCGALYGIVLYAAMNFVVVPLSAAGTGLPKAWTWMDLSHLAAHMFLVGVPCAVFARKALSAPGASR